MIESLFIFCVLVTVNFAMCALLHIWVLRSFAKLGFWKSSLATNLLTFGLIAGGVYFVFPSASLWVLPAGVSAFFAYQLFFFLGVATADRSLTAHLLILLAKAEAASVTELHLRESFLADDFIAKRLQECRSAKLLEGQTLRLQPRALSIAKFYKLLIVAYRLERRATWKFSFENKVDRHHFDLSKNG